jgi:hypothetical protein
LTDLRDLLGINTFITEIRMIESPVLVVEGSTDVKLYNKFFLHNVRIICPNQHFHVPDNTNRKGAVIETIKAIQEPKVIGIVDSDFLKIRGTRDIDFLFFTDYHDMDVNLFFSQGLERFIQINQVSPNGVNSIRFACSYISTELGYYALSLYLEGDSHQELHEFYDNLTIFIDENLDINYDNLLEYLPEDIIEQIEEEVEEFRNDEGLDLYQVVNGHHLFLIFAYLIWIGIFPCNFNPADAYENPEHFGRIIEDVVRDYYQHPAFRSTDLYDDILEHQTQYEIMFLQEFNP